MNEWKSEWYNFVAINKRQWNFGLEHGDVKSRNKGKHAVKSFTQKSFSFGTCTVDINTHPAWGQLTLTTPHPYSNPRSWSGDEQGGQDKCLCQCQRGLSLPVHPLFVWRQTCLLFSERFRPGTSRLALMNIHEPFHDDPLRQSWKTKTCCRSRSSVRGKAALGRSVHFFLILQVRLLCLNGDHSLPDEGITSACDSEGSSVTLCCSVLVGAMTVH